MYPDKMPGNPHPEESPEEKDQDLRYRCLSLASTTVGEKKSAKVVVEGARKFYDFVKGNDRY